eukprot:CAMPEP_0171138056 /NCGR_PEP_ID=MMETSP0766_2-20121228/134419_1 /TAXON_ID=439317 /ORGANISM="Gambierdiscus australes, Strain CAWD 149" /LENGTH=90 /DNA_ID=CAMNT_0011601659 /DNA_START=75 /DNA_END=347 /DNA_ORIENTATION=-
MSHQTESFARSRTSTVTWNPITATDIATKAMPHLTPNSAQAARGLHALLSSAHTNIMEGKIAVLTTSWCISRAANSSAVATPAELISSKA